MLRRKFLILLSIFGMGAIALLLLDSYFYLIRRILYRVEDLFKEPAKLPADFKRLEVELPSGGETISVEKALNSRCTSDSDENQKKFHWGMFDRTKKLSGEQIERVIGFVKIPRFTPERLEIRAEQNTLTFVVNLRTSGIQKDWMMVESGMQQQAVGLVCAALGVGMVFNSLGKDGGVISGDDHATIRIKLDAMKPSYDGSFWSNLSPADWKTRVAGKLPDPARDGDKPLLATLAHLTIRDKGSKALTDQSMSQLLWAARGRTPHFYRSRSWGLTIPTWGGEQNISSIYLFARNSLSKYINWRRNRPTHELSELHKIDKKLFQQLSGEFSAAYGFIIFEKNENFGRALWEVGYQLLNVLLQAKALGIFYQAFLLNETQKSNVRITGVNDPVAILAV